MGQFQIQLKQKKKERKKERKVCKAGRKCLSRFPDDFTNRRPSAKVARRVEIRSNRNNKRRRVKRGGVKNKKTKKKKEKKKQKQKRRGRGVYIPFRHSFRRAARSASTRFDSTPVFFRAESAAAFTLFPSWKLDDVKCHCPSLVRGFPPWTKGPHQTRGVKGP